MKLIAANKIVLPLSLIILSSRLPLFGNKKIRGQKNLFSFELNYNR
jgi:hypothetical protein